MRLSSILVVLFNLILTSSAVAGPQKTAEVIWQVYASEYVAVWCQRVSASLNRGVLLVKKCVRRGKSSLAGTDSSVWEINLWNRDSVVIQIPISTDRAACSEGLFTFPALLAAWSFVKMQVCVNLAIIKLDQQASLGETDQGPISFVKYSL